LRETGLLERSGSYATLQRRQGTAMGEVQQLRRAATAAREDVRDLSACTAVKRLCAALEGDNHARLLAASRDLLEAQWYCEPTVAISRLETAVDRCNA
jgi:hypothetical protein